MKYLKEHKKTIRELQKSIYKDNTYNEDLEVINLLEGYQVSFYQINKQYTIKEYNNLVKQFLKLSIDNNVYFGKFGDVPEISFCIENLEIAIELAKQNNQISIWSWKLNDEIKTNGSGKEED